jgi:hypothetical protein
VFGIRPVTHSCFFGAKPPQVKEADMVLISFELPLIHALTAD